MGRPSLLTEEVEIRICRLIKVGLDEQDACLAEVSRRTYVNWKARAREGEERFVSFFENMETAASQRNARLAMLVVKAAEGGAWQAAIKMLAAHRPGLYGERANLALSGADGGPIQTAVRYVVTVPEPEPDE